MNTTNQQETLDTEDQIRNESIKRVMDDLRESERRILGNACYDWLVSIGVIKQ